MKMSEELYLELKTLIETVIKTLDISLEDFELSLKTTRYRDFELRVAWDLFYLIPISDRVVISDKFYEELNDKHISTALKRIVKEYKEGNV